MSDETATGLLSFVHVATTIGWLGGVFFILVYVHPATAEYFEDHRERDTFLTTLADGARWHVLAAFAAIGASGVGIVALHGGYDGGDVALLAVKVIALALATAVFCFETFYLWPRRVFATLAELPAAMARFRQLAFVLFGCGSVGVILGTLVAYR
jgi:uncharacterized membrane protein